MTTILIVEDDPGVRAILRAGFEAEGWKVREAPDRGTAMTEIESENVDLVTLDLGLGVDDGLDLVEDIRVRRNIPILVVSGKTSPFDRARGLESGADDYVVKPFLIREVTLRVHRILDVYRREIATDQTVNFDHTAFDLQRRVVRHLNGEAVPLTEVELQLLELFVRHPGRVLSRDDISLALYGREWTPYDRAIDGHVARLRRKIEPLDETPTLIRSVRGVGYVFTGDVRPVELSS